MPNNDPTTRPVDFHNWLLWRARQKDHPFADLESASDQLYQLACDELCGLARAGIVEITGSVAPAGLLGRRPAAIPSEALQRRRLITTHAVERDGAYMRPKQVPILIPRVPGAGPAYDGLTFRLAEPAAFAQYLDDLRPPPRRPIPKSALIALLRDDAFFRRHRAEKRLPAADLLQAVAKDQFPDLAVPRDSRLREALKELSVREMYGNARRGPQPAWAKALRESISRKSNTSP